MRLWYEESLSLSSQKEDLIMLKKFRNSTLALGIVTYLLLFWTSPGTAAMIDSTLSNGPESSQIRIMEISKIQTVLENKVVTDKLSAYGLSADEIRSKLSQMTDDQVHMLAQASDNVLAGGDGLGLLIGVLLIILLVIVILKLLNKEIVVR
jgi:hypothetical protein